MSVSSFIIPAAVIPPAVIPPPTTTRNSSEHPAIRYIEQLFGYDSFSGDEEDNLFFLAIHKQSGDVRLSGLKTISEAASLTTVAQLEKLQAKDFNIYVSMNPFPAGTTARKERFVKDVRNLFIESDGSDSLGLIDAAVSAGELPAPHTVLESSLGKYHVCWHVQGFSPLEAKAMLRALAQKFGGDSASTDLHRVLRLPGFRNLKYADNPEVRLLEFHPETERYPRELFKIATAPVDRTLAPIASDELAAIVQHVEKNAAEANCTLGARQDDGDSFKWSFECPWSAQHSRGSSSAAIILLEDGRLQFNCFHEHCTKRGWSDIRQLWQEQVGHVQTFGKPPALPVLDVLPVATTSEDVSAGPTCGVTPPKYPEATIDGDLIGEMTRALTRGTFIPPQFVREIVKTCLGSIVDGKVGYPGHPDIHTRQYTHNVSYFPESGKGESFKRTLEPNTGWLYQLLGQNRFALKNGTLFGSGEIMGQLLKDSPNTIARWDEMSDMWVKNRALSSTLEKKLLSLFESNSIAQGSFANGVHEANNVHFSLIGDFTFGSFEDSFTGQGARRSGYLSRGVYQYSNKIPHAGDWEETDAVEVKRILEAIRQRIQGLTPGSRTIPAEDAAAKTMRLGFSKWISVQDGHLTPRLEAHLKRDVLLRAFFSDGKIDAAKMALSIAWCRNQLDNRRILWPEDVGSPVEIMTAKVMNQLRKNPRMTDRDLIIACNVHRPGCGGAETYRRAIGALVSGTHEVEIVGKTRKGHPVYSLVREEE